MSEEYTEGFVERWAGVLVRWLIIYLFILGVFFTGFALYHGKFDSIVPIIFLTIPYIVHRVKHSEKIDVVEYFSNDTRGQSIGFVRFFASLIIGAPLAYFAYRVTDPILERATEQSAGTAAAPASGWFVLIGENLVLVFLLIAFFGLIALSIFQRRVTG